MRSRRVVALPSIPASVTAKLIGDPRRYAAVGASLLTPVALIAWVMAFWRLGADLNLLSEFFISNGLLSRWQVWLALAIITQLGARQLNRTERPNDTVTP